MTNLQRQYDRNATGLEQMRDKARATGRKVNGYTLAELEHKAATYRRLAGLPHADLVAHVRAAFQRLAAGETN